MKLKFKVQPYQTNAVDAVVDCFAGQPKSNGLSYRIDPGRGDPDAAFERGSRTMTSADRRAASGQHSGGAEAAEPAFVEIA